MRREVLMLAMLLPLGSQANQASGKDAPGVAFFEKDVRPLLVKRCYACHSARGKTRGGLRLDSRAGWEKGGDTGPALRPGDPDRSLLIQAIRHGDAKRAMPPAGKLPEAEIAILVRWVRMGAPDPRTDALTRTDPKQPLNHWAFQPPRLPAIPEVKDATWPRGEIDRFIRARQEKVGLRPARDAEELALLRRLTFDLTGLPPTLEEIDSFLSAARRDPRAAIEKVVDRLLASPHFGEHWGRHWLDLARYADTSGAANDLFLVDGWRYRDHVVRALNQDRPYDRFVREQIAGDLLPFTSLEQRDELRIATGLLALGIHDYDRYDEGTRLDQIDEQIDVVGRAILGLTISCARCHDHKYDPLSQKEYTALAGIFSSTAIRKTAVYTRGKHTLVRVSLGLPLEGYRQEPVARFIRLQEALYAGRQPVVRMGWELNRTRAALARAKDQATVTKLKALVQKLEKTLSERRSASTEAARTLRLLPPLPPMALGVCDGERPHDQVLRIRGEFDQKGAVVPRGFPALILRGKYTVDPRRSGRLELARWLTDPDNPLTARVMVNRIWYHLFGEGLVSTLDNFGVNGELPSHPELLDWLALRFVDEGWLIKKMIRRLVLSRTYQLATQRDRASEAIDGDDRLLWRSNRRRLPAEALRDAVLAFSGDLDRTPRPRSLVAELGPDTVRFNKELFQYDSPRRSLYLPQPRGRGAEFLRQFDLADSKEVVARRDVTTVPSQALYLLNSPFVLEQARRAARGLLEAKDLDDAGRIDRAFRLALGRPATAHDHEVARKFLAEYDPTVRGDERTPSTTTTPTKTRGKVKGKKASKTPPAVAAIGATDASRLRAWSGLCQVLIGSSEFRYLH